jgi:pimeloyl-ACP methyl ester carboxylesterase
MLTSVILGLCASLIPETTAPADDLPRLEFKAIEFTPFSGEPTEAERGTLTVRERFGAVGGKLLELPVLRLKSRAARPKSTVIHLVGGPGGSGLLAARSRRQRLFDALREVADVVTYDQRGAGEALPKLAAGERASLPLDQLVDRQTQLEALFGLARTCAEKLRGEGHDLAAYNTVESAHDLDQLRAALGVEKITLWGTSYGTHLALAYARLYPQRVERMVLAGIEGPDHTYKLPSDQQRQLERIAEWVKSDPEVSRAIPDFVGLVREVLARVERSPVTTEVTVLGKSQKMPLTISRWDLERITAEGIGRTRTAHNLPLFYWQMSQGDFSRVAQLVRSQRNVSVGGAMADLMDSASSASVERLARIRREATECLLGDAINFPFPDIRAAWNVPELPEDFRAPLVSDVPTLLISGTLDGRTPPTNAEEIRAGLTQATHLLIENAGHDEDLFSESAEMRQRIVAFVQGEKVSGEPIKIPLPMLAWPGRE